MQAGLNLGRYPILIQIQKMALNFYRASKN
uniref:Uncharacterized protein n=1 Tax=Anguilla anguilla TaxID=7936 RepID=A0A0E9QKM3_ANGAN